jgi:hypothetical protein
VAESAEGARLLSECTGSTRTEGSNPSLSASFQMIRENSLTKKLKSGIKSFFTMRL